MLIVSNRLPVNISKYSGRFLFRPSVGGLATGLASICGSGDCRWLGWPGITADKITANEREEISVKLRDLSCVPVYLTQNNVEQFYHGFCNKTIWPLFHYFPRHTFYEIRYWQAYKEVNEAFCEAVLSETKPDEMIWVHDFHLMLLPSLLREKLPDARIGFFLHIPFPSFELFRNLPWREEILRGLLGSDMIGFHTYDYVRHFISSATRILKVERSISSLVTDNRIVKADVFPMGIDYDKFANSPDSAEVQRRSESIRRNLGGRKIILSVDRLDYTKGIIERAEAFDLFLSQNNEYKDKVTLVLIAVPSRTVVADYVELRQKLEALIGRINGEHGTIGWTPIIYLYRTVPFDQLAAFYNIADIAIVTPLRDGMNLIAKEFVATKKDGKGVLILSEMAGAASELGEALTVNPFDKQNIVDSIKEAFEMPVEEQQKRNRLMQARLSRYTVARWASDFLETLEESKTTQDSFSVRTLSGSIQKELAEHYMKSKRRLFLLDYDGTLVSFFDRPDKAMPDEKLLELISLLTSDNKNEVVVISGRNKDTLEQWFRNLSITIVAEHGAWIKNGSHEWKAVEAQRVEWKKTIRPFLEIFTDRTPGSFVEEKDYSLVWHFRKANPELASIRSRELKDALLNLASNLEIGIYEGNKIIEVKQISINKGRVSELWLGKANWDFIICAGDDYTDEDMFAVMPENSYTIKIGFGMSKARFKLDTVQELRTLLETLTKL